MIFSRCLFTLNSLTSSLLFQNFGPHLTSNTIVRSMKNNEPIQRQGMIASRCIDKHKHRQFTVQLTYSYREKKCVDNIVRLLVQMTTLFSQQLVLFLCRYSITSWTSCSSKTIALAFGSTEIMRCVVRDAAVCAEVSLVESAKSYNI